MTTEPMSIDEMKEASAFILSDMAQCESPDTNGSPGAKFLISVRDKVVRAIEDRRITLEDFDDHGQCHSIADDAPSIYTHERWRQFVDLGAFNEEPEYDDAWPKDLNQAAAVALYQIADRLTSELCRAWREGWECPTCGEGVEGPSGCTDDEDDGCQNDARHLIRMVAERMDAKAAEADAEPLPVRTPGVALAEARTADMEALTAPVDLSLIDQAEATDMGIRVARRALVADRAVSRFRRKVWMVAGVLAVLIITAGVILTV